MCFIQIYRTKSINKKSKGVEVKKDKLKEVVKPSVLKKVGEKLKVEASPFKIQQQDLWFKAIDNVSKKPDLSEQESIIVKLLSEYKNKSSIPHKKIKLQVLFYFFFITFYFDVLIYVDFMFFLEFYRERIFKIQRHKR